MLLSGITRTGHVFNPRTQDRAQAVGAEMAVQFSAVNGAVTYAIALHEIGHCLGRNQSKSLIQAEIAAWLWARAHAIVWTPAMAECARKSLMRYAARWDPKAARMPSPGSALGLTPKDVRARRRRARRMFTD
jgi:hypothetical protein